MHVTEPWTAAVAGEWAVAFQAEEYEETAAANAKNVLARVAEEVACETFHIKDQFAAEGIVEEAKARNCDLIVMGSHGRRDFARFLLGSQALTHSAVPVLEPNAIMPMAVRTQARNAMPLVGSGSRPTS